MTDNGANTAIVITTQIKVYTTGCWSDHTSDSGASGGMLPNSSLAAWVTDDTGFHSAKVYRDPGRSSAGTNVLAMNDSGKMTMNEALLITSTLGTSNAMYAITHETA